MSKDICSDHKCTIRVDVVYWTSNLSVIMSGMVCATILFYIYFC
jgi:hypothetical protein